MNDTIAAQASANGEGAVSIIRISGSRCAELIARVFATSSTQARKMTRAVYRDCSGGELDDVLYAFFPAPASYTGEDCAEIYCHGNPFIVQKILQDLFANECRPATAGEFTRRAFTNNKLDLSQAEAVQLMIGARCQRSLTAARKQLSGELGKRINAFSDELVNLCALTEAYIDFPEDDLPEEDKTTLINSCKNLSTQMRALAETSKYSALVHQGLNVAIAGAPNAGKSSLLNALLGQNRAIVSDTAGTTRDFIAEKIVLGDFALNIIDTAGLRESADTIEAQGVALAKEKILSADLKILTIDSSENPQDYKIEEELYASMSRENTIIALNKRDLGNAMLSEWSERFANFTCVNLSCVSGEGLDVLKSAIIELIQKHHIRPAADDILVSARHADSLNKACQDLTSAIRNFEDASPAELAASDLRAALNHIGDIVGKSDIEDILDKIFSKFCIGK